MNSLAVVFEQPERLSIQQLDLSEPGAEDVVVDVHHSGISTGTEKLLWTGRMPMFPGMGYPLVPGYESVGVVSHAGDRSGHNVGETVYVPGARCYGEVRGLFGGASSCVVVPGAKALTVDPAMGEEGVLLALAATAYHAVAGDGSRNVMPPELIVGHGVLGRLIARMTVAAGFAPPTVWEVNALRMDGATGYPVVHPDDDPRRDYRSICDVSGDASLLDSLIARLAKGGEVVLAGFYTDRLAFDFAPAFMREAQIRTAAEWRRPDLLAVKELVETGRVSLGGLITHRESAERAADAYPTAFNDATCLKMILDWRACS
ncbi:MAG: chlorophyll synthesis pathway protein BchC [Burkholderiaceae bacterium]